MIDLSANTQSLNGAELESFIAHLQDRSVRLWCGECGCYEWFGRKLGPDLIITVCKDCGHLRPFWLHGGRPLLEQILETLSDPLSDRQGGGMRC